MKRVGLVGLGSIGQPMALNLHDHRFDLSVFDVSPAALEPFRGLKVHVAESPKYLAERSEIISVCVRDDEDVLGVVIGSAGLLEGATSGTLIAIHSTVRRSTILDLAKRASAAKVDVIDAPVTRVAHGTRERFLTFMVGGSSALLERARPAFEASSQDIIHAGELGAGAVLKLANNLVTYLQFVGMHEGLRLARAGSIDPALLLEVAASNGNLTPAINSVLGFRARTAADADLLASAEAFAALAEKDLDCALALAEETGLALPAGVLARALIRGVFTDAAGGVETRDGAGA